MDFEKVVSRPEHFFFLVGNVPFQVVFDSIVAYHPANFK